MNSALFLYTISGTRGAAFNKLYLNATTVECGRFLQLLPYSEVVFHTLYITPSDQLSTKPRVLRRTPDLLSFPAFIERRSFMNSEGVSCPGIMSDVH